MQFGSTLLLKTALIFMAAAVVAVCIFALPVAYSSDLTGYYRPILIGLYLPVVPYLFAIYQAWKLLVLIDDNKAFSILAVKALARIKYCAFVISGLFTLGMPYIYQAAEIDDAPGVILLGLIIIFASIVVGTFAALLQKLMKNGLHLKTEQDLIV